MPYLIHTKTQIKNIDADKLILEKWKPSQSASAAGRSVIIKKDVQFTYNIIQ